MSNRINKSFVPAKPTARIGTNPPPEREKPPSTKLVNIVPRNFVKAVPRRTRSFNSNTNPELSSSSSTPQEEQATDSEERSATIEYEASSLTESDQSTEKIQRDSNAEENIHLNTEQSFSTSGGQIPLKTPWTKIPSDQKELIALRAKRRRENRELKRADGQFLPRTLKSALESSSKPEAPSGTTKSDHSFVLPTNSSDHDLSQRLKKTIMNLVPERRIQTPLEILQKSDLYKDALKGGQHLVSLRPEALKSYLSSLLNDDNVAETIEKYKVPADAVVAVKWYGQDGFPYVQQSLRGKPDPSLGEDNLVAPPKTFKNLVKACERGFAKLPPLPHGTKLFRGTNFLFDDNLNPGDVYTDPAFVSTSTSQDVAKQKFEGSYLLKIINVPEDDPRWRDISSLTGNPKEAEVLCLPNASFRVISRGEGAKRGAGKPGSPAARQPGDHHARARHQLSKRRLCSDPEVFNCDRLERTSLYSRARRTNGHPGPPIKVTNSRNSTLLRSYCGPYSISAYLPDGRSRLARRCSGAGWPLLADNR